MYYVYTLAYPDGTVFYVGKGKGRRMHQHELETVNNRFPTNWRKTEIIQEILARGERVLAMKVAEFEWEKDAFIYEWGLMCMHCRADQFTNQKHAIKPVLSERERELARERARAKWQIDLFRWHKDEIPDDWVRTYPISK